MLQNPPQKNCQGTLINLLSDLLSARLLALDLLTLQRSRRGRRACSWVRHRGRCGWRLPADSADTQSAPARSGTFPPAVRSQWWLLLEEPGRSLCDPPCGQSDWDQDPSVLASGEESGRVGVGSGHLYGRKWHLIYCVVYELRHRVTCTDTMGLIMLFIIIFRVFNRNLIC